MCITCVRVCVCAVLQDVMRFDEDVAKKYIAEVVLALEYVHSKVCVGRRTGRAAGL